MFAMLIIWCKIQKKITANYNSFDKMNPIKGLQLPCQKCMDKFFDPYFDILMNCAAYFEKPQKGLPKFYLLNIFGKENLYFTSP